MAMLSLADLLKSVLNRTFLTSSLEANLKKGTQRTLNFGLVLPLKASSSKFCHCEAGKLRLCLSKGQLGNVAILTQLPAENQLEDCHVVLLEDISYLRSKSFLAMTEFRSTGHTAQR
ncbi:MAG: hypothetical protein Q4B50_07425 [Bacillota bacterium]|nr:hypothetical protein [Bacillota bacterium]